HLAASGLTSTAVPDSFSWTNADEVKKYRGLPNYSVNWIMKPPNQSVCGSCWAVSASASASDRLSIAQGSTHPPLAAAVTGSCATNQAGAWGCDGGWPSDAFCVMTQTGVPADSCWPYAQFCAPEATSCSTTGNSYACCGGNSQIGRASLSGDDAGQT